MFHNKRKKDAIFGKFLSTSRSTKCPTLYYLFTHIASSLNQSQVFTNIKDTQSFLETLLLIPLPYVVPPNRMVSKIKCPVNKQIKVYL